MARKEAKSRKARSGKQSPTTADALARYRVKRKDDETALLADPEIAGDIEHGRRWKEAQREATKAAAPFQSELEKLIAAHPSGYLPESDTAERIEALKWAVQDAQVKAYTKHGFRTTETPPADAVPKTPAELLERIEQREVTFRMTELAYGDYPSEDAEAFAVEAYSMAVDMRKRDPELRDVPELRGDPRAFLAMLREWCIDAERPGGAGVAAADDDDDSALPADVIDENDAGGEVPALTKDHWLILAELARTPQSCRTVIDVAGSGPIRNRETVGRLLRELAEYGLVHRPHGKRKGYALTDAGRKWPSDPSTT